MKKAHDFVRINQLIKDMYINRELLIPTGFRDIDRMLNGGLVPSSINVIAGRPGMGTTSFALSIVCNVARLTRKAIVYFSLDMLNKAITARLISAQSDVSIKGILRSRLQKDCWYNVRDTVEEISKMEIFIFDRIMKVSDMTEICKGVTDLGLIIIDPFQNIISSDYYDNYSNSRKIINEIEIMARLLEVPVIITSKIPRECEMRNDRRPLLSDFENSPYKLLESHSDVFMLLFREYYYNNNEDIPPHLMECIIAKNRIGNCGTTMLYWDCESLSIRDFDRYTKS